MQSGAFCVANHAGAVTAWACGVRTFVQGRANALTAQFHQAETADLAHLHACAVKMQAVFHPVFHFLLVAGFFHVDEVDHDQATQVAQAQLAGYFFCRFQVGTQSRVFNVGSACGAGRVHVDRHQCFGVVDHDGATRRQGNHAAVRGFNLVFNLETAEQGSVVAVALHQVHHVGHDMLHELLGLIVNFIGINEHFANIRAEVITNGANHEAAFLIDQERAVGRFSCAVNCRPQLQQVVQIPLQFFYRAANACGAGNNAHALWVFKFVECFAQFLAFFPFNSTGNTTTAWVVGH